MCHCALADFGGALEEQVGTSAGLWEGDDVSDRLRLAENGHQTVETCGRPDQSVSEAVHGKGTHRKRNRRGEVPRIAKHAANDRMRPSLSGRAKAQCQKQLRVPTGFAYLQDLLEDILLHSSVVYTHGAATDLNTIEDKIVVLSAHLHARSPIKTHDKHRTVERLTASMSPAYIFSTSCHIGAVKGWCELLHRPCARNSLSASARVNSGNSVTQRNCGSDGSVRSPRDSASCASARRTRPRSVEPPCATVELDGRVRDGYGRRTSGLRRRRKSHT